ncbi:restriction endonuclease subunit S [Eggerthellaceae bacterium 3-80]
MSVSPITWEQRKASELVTIERGGSPRPIENYITDDIDGLNWVKIGDAPELGRYITQTKERIRPEGLPKTREVHPGDLLLSNSMSFGRPYIMAVDGCIHDGWLLIRDRDKKLDPQFLCHMLGTPQMLNQYRMLAAGSAVNNLNKELVGNARVSFPLKEEQCLIGAYLDSFDSLITLHQREGCKRFKGKPGLLQKLRSHKKSPTYRAFPSVSRSITPQSLFDFTAMLQSCIAQQLNTKKFQLVSDNLF